MSDDFKALIAKVATGAALTREEAARAFDRMMSGEATPSQMGGLLMALRVRGETVDEITGAVTAMRAKMLQRRRAAPTPSTWSAPAATPRAPTTSRPARPSSWRAPACRSPSTATARCPRARAPPTCSARSASRSSSRPDEVSRCIHEAGIGFMFAPAHHPAMKNVGADARRARHPHDLQSARAAVQSGRRQAPDDRRVLAAMDRADGAGARRTSAPKASGSRTAPTASTRSPRRARPMSPRWRTARSAPSRSRPRMSASQRAKPEALRGGDAETQRHGAARRAQGQERRRTATSRSSTPRRRWWSPAARRT